MPSSEEARKRRAAYMREYRKRNPQLKRHTREYDAARRRKGMADDPNWDRRTNLRRYGMTLAGYDAMMIRQLGSCAACDRNFGLRLPPHIDHCHATGMVRALLCSQCNVALGMLEENTDRIEALAVYVSTHCNLTPS